MKIETGMLLAINAAKQAMVCGQLPFGTIIVDPDDRIIGYGAGTETFLNPTRHSEMIAITSACQTRGGLLHGCMMFQTFEPCTMCCGAINHSKISTVVVGSYRWQLPSLFHPYESSLRQRLDETTHPPKLISALSIDPINQLCIALFDQALVELDTEAAISP